MQALNNIWTLEASGSLDKMKWEQVTIDGRKRPSPRGYHTANLVQNVMIIVGGSDGSVCFLSWDIWYQIPQFGPKSNPTRYADVYLTCPHKLVLIFLFRI